jgi:hypothetical protein
MTPDGAHLVQWIEDVSLVETLVKRGVLPHSIAVDVPPCSICIVAYTAFGVN